MFQQVKRTAKRLNHNTTKPPKMKEYTGLRMEKRHAGVMQFRPFPCRIWPPSSLDRPGAWGIRARMPRSFLEALAENRPIGFNAAAIFAALALLITEPPSRHVCPVAVFLCASAAHTSRRVASRSPLAGSAPGDLVAPQS